MARKNKIETNTDKTDEMATALARYFMFNQSAPMSRLDFASRVGGAYNQYGGQREIRRVAGYKTDLTFDDYYDAYTRQDVAARVIETYPDHTWISVPEVYESEKNTGTQFEKEWDYLVKTKKIISHLRSLDILAGIGRFGIMVMGVDDGRKLDKPLEKAGKKEKRNLVYMRPYMEGEVKITAWDTDSSSPRYMLPVMYHVTPKEKELFDDKLVQGFDVHYTRVIHFADNSVNSRGVFGLPRLQRVFDRMTDILKIVAGSGEMFWRGAYQGFSFEADADAALPKEDEQKMKEAIQKYFMGLDRAMLLRGVRANPLNPAISSPKDHLDVQLTIVAIASRIPRRILSGSEQGKLASVQDAENWAQQVTIRRTNVAEPDILRPFVEFCIDYGIVTPPVSEGGFSIYWPSLEVPSDKDTSESAFNFTNALAKYATMGLYKVMPFNEYLANVWNYSTAAAEQLAGKFKEADFEAFWREKVATEGKSSVDIDKKGIGSREVTPKEEKPVDTPKGTKGETIDS